MSDDFSCSCFRVGAGYFKFILSTIFIYPLSTTHLNHLNFPDNCIIVDKMVLKTTNSYQIDILYCPSPARYKVDLCTIKYAIHCIKICIKAKKMGNKKRTNGNLLHREANGVLWNGGLEA